MKDQPRQGERAAPNMTGRTKARKGERQDRLGEALRRNLQKRKQQQRERGEAERKG